MCSNKDLDFTSDDRCKEHGDWNLRKIESCVGNHGLHLRKKLSRKDGGDVVVLGKSEKSVVLESKCNKAIKVYLRKHESDPDNEIIHHSILNGHPNIITMHLTEQRCSQHSIIVLEKGVMDAHQYTKHLSQDKRFEFALFACAQLIQAIQFCHAHRIIHGDIKPENVIVFHYPLQVKLCDFDSVMFLPPGQPSVFLKKFVGTLVFLSPETIRNKEYSFATDVWSFGVTMFDLFTKKLPFTFDKHILDTAKLAASPSSKGKSEFVLQKMTSSSSLSLAFPKPSPHYDTDFPCKTAFSHCTTVPPEARSSVEDLATYLSSKQQDLLLKTLPA